MEHNISHIQSLPFIREELRQAGDIKQNATDFIVTEIPLYTPEGEGDHLYITLSRREETTSTVIEKLAEVLEIQQRDIGCAGRKDKWACTTQTFSINIPHDDENILIEKIKNALPYTIVSYARHTNKLKMGHLLGNRFEILVKTSATRDEVLPIQKDILAYGLPNFFGEQRYGFREKNIAKGKALLQGEYRERKRSMRDLMHSAYQSFLFDCWLKTRIENNTSKGMLLGDLAKGTERGGLFTVEDLELDQERFNKREICYTGALPGYKIPQAKDEAQKNELALFEREEITADLFKKARLPGSRRMGLLWLESLDIDDVENGLRFSFSLPKGSYATNLLREFFYPST